MTNRGTPAQRLMHGPARLALNLFGLKPPKVAELPGLSAFASPAVSQVTWPLLAGPQVSEDLSCSLPASVQQDISLLPLDIGDLTARLKYESAPPLEIALSLSAIVAKGRPSLVLDRLAAEVLGAILFVPLRFPAARGKTYGQRTEDDVFEEPSELSFAPSEEDLTEECKHGIRRASCEFCSTTTVPEKPKREKAVRKPIIDVFDLILPILQPPLGEALDNIISFPPSQSLYPFQREGVQFLAQHRAALLGDEMGLGKSIQAITALRILVRAGQVRRTLLLCPKSVVSDWRHKLWDWAPELTVLVVRASPEQRAVFWGSPAHIYLTTYDTLRNDIETVSAHGFDVCLLDEIQYIKNPEAGVTKAARRVSGRIRWGLTGTPLENKLEDVISIFDYLKPGLFRASDADYASRVKDGIRPYFLRRRAADVLDDLPAKVSHEVWLELGPSQRDSYDEAYREGRAALSREPTVPHVLAQISKLKQICNLDPVTGESTKLEYLQEQLGELAENEEKALVFSQYPEKTLREIEPALEEFEPQLFHGQLSDKQRDRIVREFQEQDKSRVLLMSVRAGGIGLTLTRANHVFHFDLWWNPAVARQAEGRAHRIGQQKTVFVKTLYTEDTIERRIHDLLAEKQALFDFVIDDLSDTALKNILTEEELLGLFDLKPARPVGETSSSKALSEKLRSLGPLQFETLVASLYKEMGFATRQTQGSHDEGIDVYATRTTDSGTESLVIQCKHFLGGTIPVSTVRELYGALHSKAGANRAVLVTSGHFSRECQDYARGKAIDLIPLDQLVGLLAKYKLLET